VPKRGFGFGGRGGGGGLASPSVPGSGFGFGGGGGLALSSSTKNIQIGMENMGWNENLEVTDLGCEDAEYTGDIEFNMSFTIKIV
jgi:hypothetical protein